MEDYYKILGVGKSATAVEIKKSFREMAKKLHPDIAGGADAARMRLLLTAYKALSNPESRFLYDKRFTGADAFRHKGRDNSGGFDYRSFLRARRDDLYSQAKLIFLDLLNFEEASAVALWFEYGGSEFKLEQYLEREDWMDCAFLLAEELEKENHIYEAFSVLIKLLTAEIERPYFRHFTIDVEALLKNLVRRKLRRAVDDARWGECMRSMANLAREGAGKKGNV